ncbi:MAG: hypothetical protein GY765_09835 [bacterium]|nr:hypothetical protein [bacterium]
MKQKKFKSKLFLNKQTISNLESSNALAGIKIKVEDSLNETGCAVGVAGECQSQGMITCPTQIYFRPSKPFKCHDEVKTTDNALG